ncbi:MAG: hypothetical protein Q9181_007238 [Wetmoreana brouardii]
MRKCFARANHQDANEEGARAALRMAAKMMERYEITQADSMTEEEPSQRGGLSVVEICPETTGGRVFTTGWVEWLSIAMEKSSNCKSFWVKKSTRIEWTFYGIAEYTVKAVRAFGRNHNQILDWSEKYIGVHKRNSYCLGVSAGLIFLSNKSSGGKRRAGTAEEHRRLDRLRASSPAPISNLETDNDTMETEDQSRMSDATEDCYTDEYQTDMREATEDYYTDEEETDMSDAIDDDEINSFDSSTDLSSSDDDVQESDEVSTDYHEHHDVPGNNLNEDVAAKETARMEV